MKNFRLFPILFLTMVFSCGEKPKPLTGYKLALSSSPEEAGRINYAPWHSLYPAGQPVTLTPEPNDGRWVFQRWEGDVSGGDNPLTLKMDSDKNVVAVFVKREYPLFFEIEGQGTILERVVENPSGREYPHGQTVELTAVPDEGWVFETWGYQAESIGVFQAWIENPLRIKIEGETVIRVKFRQKPSGEPKFFLDDNGITCKCENVYVGQKGMINGVEYLAVNDDFLRHLVRQDIDLTRLCTSLVTDMSYLFMGVSIDQEIGNWDVSNVTTMEGMFAGFQNPSGWDIPFEENAILFNQPIGAWDVRNVTNMDYFVKDNTKFNQDLSKWCVIKIRIPPKETFPQNWTLPKPVWGTCPD